MKSNNKKVKYYHKGYLRFNDTEDETWNYVIKKHKSANGVHFDLRLHKPGESVSYSWALQSYPKNTRSNNEPILAYRTPDHEMDEFYENKVLDWGKADINYIDDTGINFNIGNTPYMLKNIKGKRYLLIIN